jgi:hypothetical protein
MKHLYVRSQWIAIYSRWGPASVLKHSGIVQLSLGLGTAGTPQIVDASVRVGVPIKP